MDGVVTQAELELEDLTVAILAAEDWAKGYNKSPTTHIKLLKMDARLERKLRRYYKDLSKNTSALVNWSEYRQAVKAFNINTVVRDDGIDQTSGEIVNLIFDEIVLGTALGAQAGEEIYGIKLGLNTSTAIIQDTARNHVAELVGMRIKDGQLIPNPRAEYSITETLRDDIRSSLSSSLALGEDVESATMRLAGVVGDAKRAEIIARTETVNSYGKGLNEFGKQSGAQGKEWQDTGAVDQCADNSDAGVIDFNDSFPSGDETPAAHPNCRCTMRLVYQNEMDSN